MRNMTSQQLGPPIASCVADAVRQNAIPEALNKLKNLVEELANDIDGLHKKIEPVLRQEPTTPEKDPGPPLSTIPLVTILDTLCYRVDGLSQRVNLIRNQVEL